MNIQSFSAPAKIILFGEHAVVYGQPAIAVPIREIRAYASFSLNADSKPGLHIVAEDLGQTITFDRSSEENPLSFAVQTILSHLGVEPPNLTIRLRSQIPLAGGLGSGAAITTALARAISAASDISLNNEQLNRMVYEVEKQYHGTPSGIDNTVVVYEQPVYFVRGHPIERLAIRTPFQLLIADTGVTAPTKIAVGDVRTLYETDPEAVQPMLDSIGTLVRQARLAIEEGKVEILGMLMSRNHELLQQITVSSSELDRLVNAAVDAGALGAKLSGGGRGGNMIALITKDSAVEVQQALIKAGAVRVLLTTIA